MAQDGGNNPESGLVGILPECDDDWHSCPRAAELPCQVPRAVQIFRCGVGALLLTAAGCEPVRDELFMAQPLPSAGDTPAVPTGGTTNVPQAGLGGMLGTSGQGSTITVGGEGGSDPRLNPRASFEWAETIPGGGNCVPATFTGTFSCKLDVIPPDMLEGALTIVLSGSSEAQSLTVTGGQALVFDSGMKQLLLGAVVGSLNCNTQQIIVDIPPKMSEPLGIDRQVFWLGSFVAQPTISGHMKGSLDRSTQSMAGDIVLSFQPGPKCAGSFNVRAAPGGVVP